MSESSISDLLESSELPQQPSLLELSLRKSLDKVLSPNFPEQELEELEPRQQRLLFAKMRSELDRLQDFEDKVIGMCPYIDVKLRLDKAYELLTNIEDPDMVEYWRKEWSHVKPEGYRAVCLMDRYGWEQHALFARSPDSKLELNPPGVRHKNGYGICQRISTRPFLPLMCITWTTAAIL